MLSDETIIKLWQDPKFMGSFSGVKTLREFLYTDFGEHVPTQRLYNLLKKIPNYIYQLRPRRKFPTRHYDVDSYGKVIEADLAEMKMFNKFRYFLLVVDVFSWKIFCVALRKKNAPIVQKAFLQIFEQFGSPITELQTDQGSEFIGSRSFFADHHIVFKTKHQRNKAAIAEHAIFLVKRKLYLLMRSQKTLDWVKLLPTAVTLLNARHVKKIGNLAPAEIHSMLDDVKVQKALQLECKEPESGPSLLEQSQNQAEYAKTGKIQVGSFVYLDKKEKSFSKSFDYKVRHSKLSVVPAAIRFIV
jgi:hypothetical protein